MINNKFIYYGFVLFFLIRLLFDILSSLLYLVIGSINANILVIPILMLIFSVVILYYFCFHLKQYPLLKPWCLVLIIFINILIVNLIPYDKLTESYKKVDVGLCYYYMKLIDQLFFFSIAIIMYIKYYKTQNMDNTHS